MAGLDWPDSDSSTLCRRQARLAVQISYCSPGEPVTLHVDSTGIKFRDHGERQVHKHGASRRMQWREAYIGMDERTGDVRAACFNLSRQGGSLFLLNLLKQIPEGEKIGSVTADAAYDTRGCHGVVVNRGAGARTSSARSVAHGTVWLPASATTSFTRHDA